MGLHSDHEASMGRSQYETLSKNKQTEQTYMKHLYIKYKLYASDML